ncbi:MAG: glycine betaine ABC transporter substrate-binding protein [Acidimicrobiales bacterium]
MTNRSSKLYRAFALPFALGLAAAACGSDSAGTSAGSDDTSTSEGAAETGGAAFADLDLSGVELTVGSKDFTEQLVLGEMLVQSFEAAGATVDNKVDLGGTVVNREALLSGEIDTYAEYNGTGWTVHLEKDYADVTEADGTVDPAKLTAAVAEADLAENNVVWLGQSPFNDTYGFASSPDLLDDGKPFTMDTMAAYLEANADAKLCLESEFPVRPDGLVLFEQGTGYTVPESQIEILDTGIIYTETRDGNCDFGEVFTTDGRIGGLGLNLVEDPGMMIVYNVSITMLDDVYQQNPAAFDAIAEQLFAPLDAATMTELNRRVDIDGETPADVANSFLTEQGLI